MSRSYRAPYSVDGYGTKRKRYMKNYANRVIRHTEGIPDGAAYKKFFSQYDICDYRFSILHKPIIWWRNGEPQIIECDPEWKAKRK